MYKRILPLLLLFSALILLFTACGTKDMENTTEISSAVPSATAQIETTTALSAELPQEKTTAVSPSTTAAPTTTIAFSMPEKTGDMYFTDDENNKFIQAVVQKYGSDPARLACIYVVPEGDSNHVFEFNGKTDLNGKLIRNADTLKYVYTLNADCSTITRAAGFTGNDGLSAAQGYAIFEMTKKLVLPEFEEELNG